jgi:hypothetical protein
MNATPRIACPCHFRMPGYERGWPQTVGPKPLLIEKNGERVARWYDHPYRLRIVTDEKWGYTSDRPKEWGYVSEPYQLYTEDFEDFRFLEENGWTVDISAAEAMHYPGKTIAVGIFWTGTDHDDPHPD